MRPAEARRAIGGRHGRRIYTGGRRRRDVPALEGRCASCNVVRPTPARGPTGRPCWIGGIGKWPPIRAASSAPARAGPGRHDMHARHATTIDV
jgi:hypothetical protein